MLLPFAVLGAAELACRVRGWGGYPPVLERVGADGDRIWYTTSRRATDRWFFGAGRQTGGMRVVHFRSPKSPGTPRIVLLGESAIQGFPQPLPVTNGAFLTAMLPGAEVLNLGATAVASYPLVHFLDAVLEHDPDVVVVMAGNNEYFGAYGVATLRGPARTPAGMRAVRAVRGLGMAQWLAGLAARRAPPDATLLEHLARTAPIRIDSPLRRAADRSLRAHLETIVARCRARQVPLVLCTVPTNERDLAPIGDDPEARSHFDRGVSLTRDGRHAEALQEYTRARDLDPMPWRATSAANDVVRQVAAQGAVLCDLEAAFRAASPGGAIGWELMDDHVHFSLRGQELFARTLAADLPAPLGARVPPVDPAGLGHSVYTDYVAASHMRNLFAAAFMRCNNEAAFERSAAWRDTLLGRMSAVDREAVERRKDPALHGETDRPLEFVVGVYRMNAGDFATAARLFAVARTAVPAVSLWRLESDWNLLACRRRLQDAPAADDLALCREAVHVGELLERYADADHPDLLRLLGLACNLAGQHAAAVARLEKAPRTWEVVAALADSYLQLGRGADAKRVLEQAAARSETAAPAGRMLQRLGL